ncbi:MAG: hypothetical protein GY868_10915 [Deltaproteobacteria bacterium]|nr:hypothetical protein [Deltaproteobacteria bacterium]
MAGLALLISIAALVLAYMAYQRSGGSADELKEKVDDLGISTENLRSKTADALNRLEKTIRGDKVDLETEPRQAAEPTETIEAEATELDPEQQDEKSSES